MNSNCIFTTIGGYDLLPELKQKEKNWDYICFTDNINLQSTVWDILDKTKQEHRVIVLAMGCSGRPLQKRILKKGYNVYIFDFGSLLDAFNNNDSRAWIRYYKLDRFLEIINKI